MNWKNESWGKEKEGNVRHNYPITVYSLDQFLLFFNHSWLYLVRNHYNFNVLDMKHDIKFNQRNSLFLQLMCEQCGSELGEQPNIAIVCLLFN